MIIVSDSFKKAIKSDNREIYGYVEVEYQNKSFNTSVTEIPTKSEIVADNGLVQGTKTMQQFATLENNYTLLDGSFMVWNENAILESGYVSNDIFNDINNATITITNNSTNLTTKGISIYFKENLPFDFTVTFTDTNNEEIIDNVSNNQSYVYQYFFNTEKNISDVTINIHRVEFPNNRLRIAYVDFNISDLYEGDELVNFNVTEELDLLLENLPINNCNIKLNNYPDNEGKSKFDVLNPSGITQYLTDDTKIKPYIGVLTEDNGIEYVPMGTFYLNDWNSDSDGNVTFNAYAILNKFKGKPMIVGTDFLYDDVIMSKDIGEMIKSQDDVEVDFLETSNLWLNEDLKNPDLFEYLAHVMPYFLSYDVWYDSSPVEFRKFYVNRYGTIVLDKIDKQKIDNIEQTFLRENLDYKLLNNIKYLNIKTNEYTPSNYTTRNVLNEEHILGSTEEYVWFTTQNDYYITDVTSFTYNVVSGSVTASLIGFNHFMILVKFSGTVDSVIDVNCVANAGTVQSTSKNRTIENNVNNGDTITIDLSEYGLILGNRASSLNNFKDVCFGLSPKYKISAQTMGDPSLEIGDTIAIQTRYKDVNNGYKNITITKQQFTFDGGLQCSLEGVGD